MGPADYTIGWICAIQTEYVAARQFLDEEHDSEYVSQNDGNAYTLGRIGKHNIAIAVLPHREYGTDSAASVARDMVHSFPNIKLGLMVGVGGGAPSAKHDIRLGDIVVSSPRDNRGGVLQYDFGETIQEQSFQQTRFLNQPLTALRTALTKLMADYETDGHSLDQMIGDVLDRKRRLQSKYKRPEPSTDVLYQSEIVHPSNGLLPSSSDCTKFCANDAASLVVRKERSEDEDNPAIHYGLIASGNHLMEDALIRDSLIKEHDVLCFEMEAAGLMNRFPCLVIRGICDYSDSHNNKEWQGYAAMVAAAYAKDLLLRVSAARVTCERPIQEILGNA
ncbi:MAG: hypothetical protein L6R40_008586 [Gallowayella cf. fulva]|nr:MAG: hypothetical protein L6R40_008586 [Xanthomendoza cf. fulva]